jgi:hypothetical protein
MHAMDSDPVDRSSLESKRAAGGDQILQPLRSRVSTVSQQAVVAHGYPDILCQNPHNEKDNQCRPSKVKQSSDRAKMEAHDGNCKNPIDSKTHRLGMKTRFVFNWMLGERLFQGGVAHGLVLSMRFR